MQLDVCGVFLGHPGEVFADHRGRVADLDDTPLVEPQGFGPDGFDIGHAVGHENDRCLLAAELVDLPHTALAEIVVADRKDFVDQQDFRVDVNRHGESQPHQHSPRNRS